MLFGRRMRLGGCVGTGVGVVGVGVELGVHVVPREEEEEEEELVPLKCFAAAVMVAAPNAGMSSCFTDLTSSSVLVARVDSNAVTMA